MKMVNIIIPAYNAHTTIRQAIASIGMQDSVKDIKITIVDDFSDKSYDYLLEDYKYMNINILRKPFNSGCGQARQYGIDHTDCDYLMFLDADDCLYSPDAVSQLLNAIRKGDHDLIVSNFVEEVVDHKLIMYKKNCVWMHGKIYKTKYIKDHNIRFNKTRNNEDNAFNAIVIYSGAKVDFLDHVTYVWKKNNTSLTRTGDYLSDKIGDFIINAEYAIQELIRLKAKKDDIRYCVYQYLISMYGYYIKFLNIDKTQEFYNDFIKHVKRYYAKSISNELKKSIYDGYLGHIFYNNGVIQEIISEKIVFNITVYDFIFLLKEPSIIL